MDKSNRKHLKEALCLWDAFLSRICNIGGANHELNWKEELALFWLKWHIPYNFATCPALRDLVPFVQFKKREKHTRRSVTFSSNTPPCVFFTFFKLHKWYQITQNITIYLSFLNSKSVDRKNYSSVVRHMLSWTFWIT